MSGKSFTWQGCESKSISDLPQHSKPGAAPYFHKDALETRFPLSNIKVTYTRTATEIDFTGDTMFDFIIDDANSDVLKAKILIMEVIKDALSALLPPLAGRVFALTEGFC